MNKPLFDTSTTLNWGVIDEGWVDSGRLMSISEVINELTRRDR
ncbi:MAG: hypothetical protein WC307_06260 [Candidatus Nanoarchaeia archaeon]|jgi:hypothetical protein